MCAATVNWTLFTDIPSPAQYVMLKGTIGYRGCEAWYRGLFRILWFSLFTRFFSVLTDAFLEFSPCSTTQLILHGDNGVVSIRPPQGPNAWDFSTGDLRFDTALTRPSNTPERRRWCCGSGQGRHRELEWWRVSGN